MNERIIGTCSICGGPVVVPTVIWSVVPPAPYCKQCGARMKKSYGRVIPMEPRNKWEDDDSIWGI